MNFELSDILDKSLRISRFVHSRNYEDKIQIFHSVFGSLIVMDKEGANIFNNFKQGGNVRDILKQHPQSQNLILDLLNQHFLIGHNSDEIKVIRNIFSDKSEIDINMMYLLITDRCNLNCNYCFIERGFPQNHKFGTMTEDIIERGIDLFVELSRNSKTQERRINFYGGEPLIYKNLIRHGITYLKTKHNSESIELNMVTNGCLLDKDVARFLTEHEVSVGVSIDGRKEAHDAMRLSFNGQGSYDDAIKGFLNLKKMGSKKAGISLTIGKHNVDDLKEHVQYLAETLQPSAFGFNFLVDLPGRKNPYSTDIEYATIKALEAFDYLREKGIFEERIMRRVRPFSKKAVHLKDCGAVGNQIVVSPDGHIGPCHAFLSTGEYFTRTVHDNPESIKNDSSFVEWSKRYPLNMQECLDCEALGICGGGCLYNAKVNNGSIWKLDQRMCNHNKLVLEWMLKEMRK